MTHKFDFDALGTHWWIEFLSDLHKPIDLQKQVLNVVDKFESDYSRFRPTSYLSLLNDTKKISNPTDEFVQMLKFAVAMHTTTRGEFNISVGAKLEQTGYGKTADSAARITDDLVGTIKIHKHEITMAPTVRIDFGGFGKGWLIDKLGSLLRVQGCEYFVINGGGDILVSSPTPIMLALEHPYDDETMIGYTQLSNGALASSSYVKRQWKQGKKVQTHIVNASQSKLNQTAVAGFVTAGNALYADVLSTVFLLVDEQLRKHLAIEFDAAYLQIKNDLSVIKCSKFNCTLY